MKQHRQSKLSKFGTPSYRVLPTDVLPAATKQIIDTKVRAIRTGEDAEQLAGKDNWGYRKAFLPGTVGILMHQGIEVALFYKRQLVEVTSEDIDPSPECRIDDPREAWTRLEFLHTKASMDRSNWYGAKEEDYQNKIGQLEGIAKSREIENTMLSTRVDELERILAAHKETIQMLRRRQTVTVVKASSKKKGKK